MLNSAPIPPIASLALKPYAQLHQYEIIKIVEDLYPAHYVVEARKKGTADHWFIALRHGEFSAQLDKAISDVYKIFLPNTPISQVVQDKDDFYIASRKIDNVLNAYPHNATAQPTNFGWISVLSFYLAEKDLHSGNILMNTQDQITIKAHKIDNAESLDANALKSSVMQGMPAEENAVEGAEPTFTLDEVLGNHWHFPPAISLHYNYQKEQQDAVKAIAKTDFAEVATILRQNITASRRTEMLTFFTKISDCYFADIEPATDYILANPAEFSPVEEIEELISLLDKRHKRFVKISK